MSQSEGYDEAYAIWEIDQVRISLYRLGQCLKALKRHDEVSRVTSMDVDLEFIAGELGAFEESA